MFLIHPSPQGMPGDIPLGKSPSESHPPWLTLLPQQFPVPSATQNPPTHLLHALNGILGFLLQTPFLPQDSVSFMKGGGVHAPGWPLQAEGERGGCIFAAQTSRHDICQEDPRNKHWASCQHVCQGSALFHIYKYALVTNNSCSCFSSRSCERWCTGSVSFFHTTRFINCKARRTVCDRVLPAQHWISPSNPN